MVDQTSAVTLCINGHVLGAAVRLCAAAAAVLFYD